MNGATILAEELDLAAGREGSGAHDERLRRRLVERFVVEELLAQQFLRSTPGSAAVNESAMTAARREMLARRHIAALLDKVPPPTEQQIRNFYRNNPAMFAERRLYQVRELAIATGDSRTAELHERIRAAASLDDVAKWLRRHDLRFTSVEAERTSDELPPETLAQFGMLKNNQVAVLDTPEGLRVIQLVRSSPAPLDEASAWPLIERRLGAEMRIAAVDAEIQRLSKMAAISIPKDGDTQRGSERFAAGPDKVPLFLPEFFRDGGTIKAEGR